MQRRQFMGGLGLSAAASIAAAQAPAGSARFDHVRALILAWRGGDIDGVLARVTEDVAWHTHVGSPPVNGKAAMRAVLQKLAAGMDNIRWRVVTYAENASSVLVEGVDEFTSPEGRRVALPYMGIMAFRGALISEWRDYFDRALFDRMKQGEAMPDYIAALADRPGEP